LLGLSILALGAVVLISGLVAQATIVGVIAFVICLAGVLLIITNISLNSGGKKVKKPGWGSSLEERWDRRNNEG
jgi:hypothetical protein